MPELAQDEYRALVDSVVEAMAALVARPSAPAPALAAMIESTLLAADAGPAQIDRLCDEAAALGVAAVCVNPYWVARAAARLRATPVAVATVVGFPLGAALAGTKLREAADCLRLGADELDLMINLGALQAGWEAAVYSEIAGVAALAHQAGARLKVICETALLAPEHLRRACELALDAGADFLKTSTGFASRGLGSALSAAGTPAGERIPAIARPTEARFEAESNWTIQSAGATVEGVALMRAAIAARAPGQPGARAGVKASGGIRTRAQADALVAAGATRLGTSSAAALLAGG